MNEYPMSSPNGSSVSRLFALGLALVGGFEGFTVASVTKAQRWELAKAAVEEFGLQAPRRNADDLTNLGYLAIAHACTDAEAIAVDVVTGNVLSSDADACATEGCTKKRRFGRSCASCAAKARNAARKAVAS